MAITCNVHVNLNAALIFLDYSSPRKGIVPEVSGYATLDLSVPSIAMHLESMAGDTIFMVILLRLKPLMFM